jgi:hypothetical protein
VNDALRDELLQMQQDDITTRRWLINAGELYGPHLPKDFYHPDMAAVHRRNNARLREIIDANGWPGHALVGEQAAEAAWQIAQHAILDPDLRDHCVVLLQQAVAVGDVPAWQLAKLTDSVLMQKGEPQLYGSIMVGDPDGGLIPWTIADPDNVDARRASVGLPPLAEQLNQSQVRVNLEMKVQQDAKSKDT